jgi:hypothetical protein
LVPKAQDTKIYWCDGNHEDHHSLLARETDEFWPNVTYMPRGSTMKLPDGRNVMFFGGAASIDRQWRTPGLDWFPEEIIGPNDMENLPDEEVDIMITHTCPEEFNITGRFSLKKFKDPSRFYLSTLLDMYKPKEWYFGHYHVRANGVWKDTNWHCMDMTYHSQWHTVLPDG